MVSRNFIAFIGYSMILSVEIKFKFCMRFIKLLFAFLFRNLIFFLSFDRPTYLSKNNFQENISNIINKLDEPLGATTYITMFVLSKLASQEVKTVITGDGADEIFGGYARYIIPYLEKCLDQSLNGNYESMINLLPSISILKEYKPMLKEFFKEGLFDNLDERYYKLCNRSNSINNIINWEVFNQKETKKIFLNKFNNSNIPKDDFFNKMLQFDLENSLPALLQVEDRVSMAWGLESRVPLLNHKLIEYMSSIPENIKINPGNMKF